MVVQVRKAVKGEETVQEQRKEVHIPKNRPQRVSLANQRANILTVQGQEDGFHYHWVDDKGGERIEAFKKAGYEVVTDAMLRVGDKHVDNAADVGTVMTRKSRDGKVLVLMRILQEYYDEDQSLKQREIADKEADAKRDLRRAADYGTIEARWGR